MLKKLFLVAALLASPSVVQAQGILIDPAPLAQIQAVEAQVAELKKQVPATVDYEKAEANSTVFCLYDSKRYSKGAVLPVDGQSTLICEVPDQMIKKPGESLALVWLDHAAWTAARQ